jgi:hypothetical protein
MGKKVEIFFTYNELVSVELKLMDGSTTKIEQSVSGKILEVQNMEVYKRTYGKLPIWNLQESGDPWPSHIQESRNKLLSDKNPVKIIEIKSRLGI